MDKESSESAQGPQYQQDSERGFEAKYQYNDTDKLLSSYSTERLIEERDGEGMMG